MLLKLRIENLALIEELEWDLVPGLNVLTGETGAGKSIVIDSLKFLLGERASPSFLKNKEKPGIVEGEFQLSETFWTRISDLFKEKGLDELDSSSFILRREIRPSGSSRQFINGELIPLSLLKELGDNLIDVLGPHDHQSLFDKKIQLKLLDTFGSLNEVSHRVKTLYENHQKLLKKKNSLSLEELLKKKQRLNEQLQEIVAANLIPGEEEVIDQKLNLARTGWKIYDCLGAIRGLLSQNNPSILSLLSSLHRHLCALEKFDPQKGSLAIALEQSAAHDLLELDRLIEDYFSKIEIDPEALEKLEQRKNFLEHLKRRYALQIDELIDYKSKISEQLAKIEEEESLVRNIAKEELQLLEALQKEALHLSSKRKKTADELIASIQTVLQSLGFARSGFSISFDSKEKVSPSGQDEIEFLFSPNPGIPFKPLKEIASSGEAARVMLALKAVFARVDPIPILVFDEIDANIGGEIAWKVSSLLKELSINHQVLCITHLPSMAAGGDAHFKVIKESEENVTRVLLKELVEDDRLKEIARMLGGENEEAIRLARKLLSVAKGNKEEKSLEKLLQ
ncbi:recombinase RecN [Methylacidiphilum kamchatkense Kam1]|uniref:DNA repair protein RecN n=1 Tax=Methylacidiphilum kamchatkense Kam1 TaxID=1202785 RepID=A0A0C1URZ2_9BACT|nr:DNA repair protein RecN [Methylacidiphilum kamchatkense]KIE58583.1 recombinase RecN [Methylacidiphilum kamchatkense Kam1]QDQ41308.1 DNA replication and repair protein RecN [Methylacidiphilum kamchatkense Kam1]